MAVRSGRLRSEEKGHVQKEKAAFERKRPA